LLFQQLLHSGNIRHADRLRAFIKVSVHLDLLAFELLCFLLVIQLVANTSGLENVFVTLLDETVPVMG
jgi:hypothetical protein